MPLRIWPVSILLLLLAAFAPIKGHAAMQEVAIPDLSAVTRSENDCSFLIRFDVDPRPQLGNIACGSVDVPENWSNPGGRRLQIRYAILKSLSANPAPDPVVYLEGGPGASALTGVDSRAEIFSKLRETRDVVIFDQRGTRLSSPLRCAAFSLDAAFQTDGSPVADEAASTPDAVALPPEPRDPYEIMQQARQNQAPRAADCALDRACNAAYPDLKARFIALLAKLRENPLPVAEGPPISDRDLIEVMQQLSQNVRTIPYVPLMIAELEQGNAGAFFGIIDGSLFESAPVEAPPTEDEIAQAVSEAESSVQEIDPSAAPAASPARLFFTSLQASLETLPEDEGSRLLSLPLNLEKQAPNRGVLEDFIRLAFPEDGQVAQRDALFGVLASLGDEDVQEVFEVLEQTVTLFDFMTFGSSQSQFNSVECNEEVPFQSFDNTIRIAQALEIPEMAQGVVEAMSGQFAICEVWPSGRAPAIENVPVASEIPTLIFAGAYDLQTPVSWNKSAFVTLPNGTFVEFPMTGHGAITFWPCASDIAAAFVADPVAMLNTSCTADLKPEWVLPAAGALPSSQATPPAAG